MIEMIEYLYTNGCSWTHGNGLHEDPMFGDSTSTEATTAYTVYPWPYRLGKLLNCQVQNDGWGAGSNARIVRRTVEFLERYPVSQRDKLLVVIGWTTLERNELYVPAYNRWLNYNAAQTFSSQNFSENITKEQQDLNRNIDRVQKEYVTWLHSNKADTQAYFQQVYLMKNMLENMKIKYLFFNSLPWAWGIPPTEYVKQFDKFACPNIIGPGTGENFLEFCNENSYPLSSCHHPMVEAHQKWAERLHRQLQTYD